MITIIYNDDREEKFVTYADHVNDIFYFYEQGNFGVIERVKCHDGYYDAIGNGSRKYIPLSEIKEVLIEPEN